MPDRVSGSRGEPQYFGAGALPSPRVKGKAAPVDPDSLACMTQSSASPKKATNPSCTGCRHPRSLHGTPATRCKAMGCTCPDYSSES